MLLFQENAVQLSRCFIGEFLERATVVARAAQAHNDWQRVAQFFGTMGEDFAELGEPDHLRISCQRPSTGCVVDIFTELRQRGRGSL